MDLDPRIVEQLRSPTVRASPAVYFDFVSGAKRYWRGFGDLVVDGETFEGVGDLGSLEMIGSGPGQAADEVVFTLFGSDAIVTKWREDAAEAVGRVAKVYLVFRDKAPGTTQDWQVIPPLIQLFWGTLGALVVDRPSVDDVEGQITRTMTIRAVNAFKNRRKPAFAFYNDRDQKARSADGLDNWCTFVTRMASTVVNWPQF